MYGERTRGLGAWSAADALPEQRLDVPGVTNETRHVNNTKKRKRKRRSGGTRKAGRGQTTRPWAVQAGQIPKTTRPWAVQTGQTTRPWAVQAGQTTGHGLSSPSGGTRRGRPFAFHGPVDLSPVHLRHEARRPKHVPGHGLDRPSGGAGRGRSQAFHGPADISLARGPKPRRCVAAF